MTDPHLASEFPPATREEWLKLVEKTLKGAQFEKKLVSKTYDDLKIQPLYERAKDRIPIAKRAGGAWQVMSRIDLPTARDANAEALHELENGATGLTLVFSGAPSANGYGISDVSVLTLDEVLDNVWLDGIAFRIDARGRVFNVAKNFIALAERRGIPLAKLDIMLGIDPFGAISQLGGLYDPWEEGFAARMRFAAELSRQEFGGQVFVADGRPIHDGGGSEAQELAYMLACGVAYLRGLEKVGLKLDAASKLISFLVVADADQFLTTAKTRAIRKLWARIEEMANISSAPVKIHAETAWRMMTRYEPSMNWLRTTIATFAAGTGGADAVTVLPHTAALGLADRFARRMARNLQLTLIEEASLYRVSDPNAGSGAIENLTDELCASAWKLFQEIENAGGAFRALISGLVQRKVAETRTQREKNIATRREVLIGTTQFANLSESVPNILKMPTVSTKMLPPVVKAEAIPRLRLAEPFENLRDAARQSITPPHVFLANLGIATNFSTRATFARNLFEAGGIAALGNDGFKDLAALVQAFKTSRASIVCICSSDEIYAQEAESAAKALKQAGARAIYLAGRPLDRENNYQNAGIDSFLYSDIDALAALQKIHATLGIK